MAARFEDLVNGMINVGFGVAATASERGREVIRDLNDKGERVRVERAGSEFARSISKVFEQAGGAFGDITARLGSTGETAAERVLDELILARVRSLDTAGRIAFIEHVRSIVNAVDDRRSETPTGSATKNADDGAPREDDSCSVPITGSGCPTDSQL